jgi:hypothetical protein
MGTKLYVGNLSYQTQESDLREHFGQFGTVVSANVITDRDTGRSRGFGFVEMSTDEEARSAEIRYERQRNRWTHAEGQRVEAPRESLAAAAAADATAGSRNAAHDRGCPAWGSLFLGGRRSGRSAATRTAPSRDRQTQYRGLAFRLPQDGRDAVRMEPIGAISGSCERMLQRGGARFAEQTSYRWCGRAGAFLHASMSR